MKWKKKNIIIEYSFKKKKKLKWKFNITPILWHFCKISVIKRCKMKKKHTHKIILFLLIYLFSLFIRQFLHGFLFGWYSKWLEMFSFSHCDSVTNKHQIACKLLKLFRWLACVEFFFVVELRQNQKCDCVACPTNWHFFSSFFSFLLNFLSAYVWMFSMQICPILHFQYSNLWENKQKIIELYILQLSSKILSFSARVIRNACGFYVHHFHLNINL